MSVMGPGCVETFGDLVGETPVGLAHLSRRISRFYRFLRLWKARRPVGDVVGGDLAGLGRK